MYSLLFIAKNNIKKRKGDTAVLFLLTMVATLLLYVSISVLTGTDKAIEASYNENNTADFLFMSNLDKRDEIENLFMASGDVSELEVSECLYITEGKYRKDKKHEKKEYALCISKAEEERRISKTDEIDKRNVKYNDIYLPYYLKAAEGYQKGDSCYLTIGNEEYEFRVAGFVDDILFATPLNISVYSVYISEKCMEDILKENTDLASAVNTQYRMRLKSGKSPQEFDEKISPMLTKEIPGIDNAVNLGLDAENMKGGVAVVSDISMGIIMIFSVLLITVALIIIRFSIYNFIELNIKNIGILKASGYTGVQLWFTCVLEISIISLWGIIAGNLSGAAAGKFIGGFEGIMLGIRWKQGFDIGTAVFCSVCLFLLITAAAGIAGRIYVKVTVLDALRGGIHTHNFKKNYFPLEKSKFPYPVVLAGKNILGEKMKNISIFMIVLLLSFATCAGFSLYQNFAADSDKLMDIVGVEAGNVGMTGSNIRAAGKEIEKWDETKSVLYYNSITTDLTNGDYRRSVSCDVWEDPELNEHEMMIKGHLPEYENEIVLSTNVSEALKADVGDVIYVEGSQEKLDYIISGIDQKINNMGMKTLMTMEGAKRLNGKAGVTTVYIYTRPGVSYEEMETKILQRFPDVNVMDSEKFVSETISGVVFGIMVICLVFVAVTVFVVVMVEVLLIKSKVVKEQKNYGINKALGYTTSQLVCQAMMTNIPVIAAGSVAGIILSIFLLNPMVVICFRYAGIQKCALDISPVWMIVTAVGILLAAACASALAALRIRRVWPVEILRGDG